MEVDRHKTLNIWYSYHVIGFPPFLEHCLVDLFFRVLPQLYLPLEIITFFCLYPLSLALAS